MRCARRAFWTSRLKYYMEARFCNISGDIRERAPFYYLGINEFGLSVAANIRLGLK